MMCPEENITRDVVEFAPDALLLSTLEGRILLANARAEKLFGYLPSELSVRCIADLVQDQAGPEAWENPQGQASHDRRSSFGRRRDGRLFPIEIAFNQFEKRGETFVIRLIRDVTKRAEEDRLTFAVMKELSDFKSALDEHAILAVTDTQGRITYVNDQFCRISKYSRQELIGKDHRIVNSGFHSKEFFRDLWATIGSGKVWKGEIRNRARDGSIYWVQATIVPFMGPNGRPTQYVAIRTEITDRKQAEEDRERLIADLSGALAEVRTLSGLLPICAMCKKVRDDDGNWNSLEAYVAKRTQAQFSHGCCPSCAVKFLEEAGAPVPDKLLQDEARQKRHGLEGSAAGHNSD